MKDWKMIVVSAALAFLFSFISGLLGGVGIGIILVRAISGAIIFAALGFGISLLLRRFLPELYELQTESSAMIEGDLSGIQENQSLSGASLTADSKPGIDISIDDGEENFAAEIISTDNSDTANEVGGTSQLVDVISESGPDTNADSENNQIPSNIDALPDMGGFSSTFESVEDMDGNSPGKHGAVTLDIMGEEQDPELVARALRTMVKRNQEG